MKEESSACNSNRERSFFFNAKKFELHLPEPALGKIVKSIKLTIVVKSTGSRFKPVTGQMRDFSATD